MIKKILVVSSLTAIMLLNTGCHEQPTPKTVIIEHNTTKEVLIPHNKDIKKAVAILILKVKGLENTLASKNNTNITSDKELNSLKEELSKQKQQLQSYSKKIEANGHKTCDCKKIKDNISHGEDSSIKTYSVSQTSSSSPVSTEYDSVIRDFVEKGTLK